MCIVLFFTLVYISSPSFFTFLVNFCYKIVLRQPPAGPAGPAQPAGQQQGGGKKIRI